MGRTLQNTIQLPAIFVKLFRDLHKQKKFLKNNITQILNQASSTNDGTLTAKDFIKINKYYGLAVPAILGEAFCILRRKPMSESERWASTSQGIITGLFDDFFDDFNLPQTQIVSMIEYPENIRPSNSNVRLFLEFYLRALNDATHPDLIKQQFLLVNKAQVASIEQENTNIKKERIWEITQEKGGDSVLFYRTGFDYVLEAGEKDALYQLGSLMQLENDIFDIYKDAESRISTLPTTISQMAELRKLYEEQILLFTKLSYEMAYSKKQIERFLDRIMPVINRGFVCINQYQRLEKNNRGVFNVTDFTRKQLICDMEKPWNFVRTIKYQIRNHY